MTFKPMLSLDKDLKFKLILCCNCLTGGLSFPDS